MIAAILFAASLATQPPVPAPAGCEADYDAMMALNPRAFDQDMNGGWRPLASREECRAAAAELIRIYRQTHEPMLRLLYWHEGQLRAELGENDAAVALFERSRRVADDDHFGWNHYVDATIAFVRQDRPALEAARARLAQARIPDWPADWSGSRGPMNLDVVDALLRCFGRSYRDAYGSDQCRRPDAD